MRVSACLRIGTVVIAGLTAPAAGSSPDSAVPPDSNDAILYVMWSDPGSLLKDGLLPRGAATLKAELLSIFAAAGIATEVVPLTEETAGNIDGDSAIPILVVLSPRRPAAFGLPPTTLGAVIGRDGPLRCVYVFDRPLRRALGLRDPRSTQDFHQLGRAVARVAAHEIVHALAPDFPHRNSGLMQPRLSRSALTQQHLLASPTTTARLRRAASGR